MSDSALVLVDLSNVVKDATLGLGDRHADLGRWDLLRAQWMKARGAPNGWLLVADASIVRSLNRSEIMRIETLRDRGELIVVNDADAEVLGRAVETKGTVLSNDRFVDHLRMPGLDHVTLVGWRVHGGSVVFMPRSLDRLQSVLISQRAAKQLRKEHGLADDAPQLAYRWLCRDNSCRSGLVAVPRVERGEVLCPSCGSYLERGPLWRQPIWLKILHRGDEIIRFVLEDADWRYVGRAIDDDTVSLAGELDLAGDVMKLDPHHLEVHNDNGQLWVTDLESNAGTAIRHPAAGRRNVHMPPAPLPANTEVAVGRGVKVVLGRTPFVIQISGSSGS